MTSCVAEGARIGNWQKKTVAHNNHHRYGEIPLCCQSTNIRLPCYKNGIFAGSLWCCGKVEKISTKDLSEEPVRSAQGDVRKILIKL